MKFSVELTIDEMDLINSGTFLTHSNSNIKMKLIDEGPPIFLKIQFQNDDQDKKARVVTKIESTDTVELSFLNFNNPLGFFSTFPLLIGSSYDRHLYLTYAIYGIPESNLKKFDYSIYLGEEVINA